MSKMLSQRGLDAAKPKAKRYGIADGIVPGLQLITHPSGSKTFALLCRIHGKQINLKIGDAAVLTLAQAREAARAKLAQVGRGEDPRMARQKTAGSFAAVAAEFVERHAKAHNRDWRKTERLLEREVLPHWGGRPLASIGKRDVTALLDGIVDRGVPIQANRTLACVRKLFGWCCERGLLEVSPADRIKKPGAETARERALSDAELALVWRASDTLAYPYGPIVKLLILTGQRRSEVAEMVWGELDSELSTWVLPPARTKNEVEHHVPVTAAMREILERLPRIAGAAGYVFTTTGNAPPYGFYEAKQKLDAAIAALNGGTPIAPWVLHDLRRTTATALARLGTPLPVVEKILNHVSGSFAGVAGVYQRHTFRDEMAAALTRWSEYVTALAQPEPDLLRVVARR